jgi:hypothetical protein
MNIVVKSFDENYVYKLCDIDTCLGKSMKLYKEMKKTDDSELKSINELHDDVMRELDKINSLNINTPDEQLMMLFKYRCWNILQMLMFKTHLHIGDKYIKYIYHKHMIGNSSPYIDDIYIHDNYYLQAWKNACKYHDDDFDLGMLIYNYICSTKNKINFLSTCIEYNKVYMIDYVCENLSMNRIIIREYFLNKFGRNDVDAYKLIINSNYNRIYDFYQRYNVYNNVNFFEHEFVNDSKNLEYYKFYVLISLRRYLQNNEFNTTQKIRMYDLVRKYWKYTNNDFKHTIMYNFNNRRLASWLFTIKKIKQTCSHIHNERIDTRRIIEKIE